MKTWRMVTPACFYTRFDEVWKVTEKIWRDKGCSKLSVGNGNLAGPVHGYTSQLPSALRSGCSVSWEGTSSIRVLWPASGAWKRVLPPRAISQIPSLKMFNTPRCPVLWVVCPEPHHWQEWFQFSESKSNIALKSQIPSSPTPHSTGSSFLVFCISNLKTNISQIV